LFGSYSHSGIPGFPFLLFCSQEQNSWNKFRNIFLFQNIPNERALNVAFFGERETTRAFYYYFYKCFTLSEIQFRDWFDTEKQEKLTERDSWVKYKISFQSKLS